MQISTYFRVSSSAALILAHCMCAGAAAPNVSNVRASQRTQSQLVDVFYDLTATNSGPFSVSVAVSTNNGTTYDLPAVSFTGSGFGSAVTPGTRIQIVWNAGSDWPGKYSSAVRFKVTASENVTTCDYMVVDLSAGPSASSYPVSYLNTVPVDGWTDEYKTTKLVMRRIPAGTFTMGERSTDYPGAGDYGLHQVTISQPFYIGVFEVTQQQWERVMGTWPSYFNNASYRNARPVEQVSYNAIRGTTLGTNWPASSSVDTDTFMGRLRSRTGKAFDLPTESQWEYVGRAGTTTALNSGYNLTNTSSDARMAEVGRYSYNGGSGFPQDGDTSVATAKVGSYLPNAWGLYDIHGNVWEWCLDWYGTFPGTVTDPVGATSGSARVFRGGNWGSSAMNCRVAFRTWYGYPGTAHKISGFRAALPPGQQ